VDMRWVGLSSYSVCKGLNAEQLLVVTLRVST
jgi:hypothetical protein